MSKNLKIVVLLHLLVTAAQPLHAAVTLDGSLGRSGPVTGPGYAITPDLGRQSGANLFHSFSSFNLIKGDVATFSGPVGISNIISRVTGGSPSSIDGTLRSTILGANLYFLNPAGVMFGPNASLDISGSFHVSTVNYLKFPDGNFYADTTKTSSFSAAAPEAFGFLGTNRAAVTIKDGASLAMKPSQAFSIVGGDIVINNGKISTLDGGTIRVAAFGRKAGEVALTGALPAADGDLSLTNGGKISSSTWTAVDAGSIKISSGTITIDGGKGYSNIYSTALAGSGKAGDIDVTAAGNLSVANGGSIYSSTQSSGSAGAVKVSAESITLDGKGYYGKIYSDASVGSEGNAGSVEVTAARSISITDGGRIASSTFSLGTAGAVKVSAESIAIDRQESTEVTGIFSQASTGSFGNAGTVEVTTSGNLSIVNGGIVASSTFAVGNAGVLKVRAGSVAIDGQSSSYVTGISSQANRDSSGDAGSIDVYSAGNLSIMNGGIITSNTFAAGNAGVVKVRAGTITINRQGSTDTTGISSDANVDSSGNAGSVEVTATGNLSIVNGGRISSDTYSLGDAGSVRVNAGSIAVDKQGSTYLTGIFSQARSDSDGNAGTVEVTSAGNISVMNGGKISSDTSSWGNAGSVRVNAGSITIDGQNNDSVTGIFSDANSDSYGNAGSVEVTTSGNLSIVNAGRISSDTYAYGDAGSVRVNAGSIAVDKQGSTYITGIFSQARSGSDGNAGTVEVMSAGNISVMNGGKISSDTSSLGNAGLVRVSAGSIAIDGQNNDSITGIFSDANSGSYGNAGSVEVTATGNLSIVNGGRISSDTYAYGDAGSVRVKTGSIAIDKQASTYITGIFSQARSDSDGNAGSVEVTATGNISVKNGGKISSDTSSWGNAGSVRVSAGSIAIDGQNNDSVTGIFSDANYDSFGNAGSVEVTATGDLSIVNAGRISSDTFSYGNAGSVKVRSANISINKQESSDVTGIFSDANYYSFGNAGTVEVIATGNLAITNGGIISSSTFSDGIAGSVVVQAGTLLVDGMQSGINARATRGSSGQTGNVSVLATEKISLANEGALSIQNDATVDKPASLKPTGLSVTAPVITLDGGLITAATTGNVAAGSITVATGSLALSKAGTISTTAEKNSSGNAGNVSIQSGAIILFDKALIASESLGSGKAGNLDLQAAGSITLIDSSITTATANADGGSISIAPTLLHLKNSSITTSVKGGTGNGGNIDLTARQLVIDNSKIVAQADAGNGGNIHLNADVIIQSPIGSLISASSNLGVQGSVVLSSAVLDVNAALVDMPSSLRDITSLSPRRCVTSGDDISSFVVYGCGAATRQPDAAILGK